MPSWNVGRIRHALDALHDGARGLHQGNGFQRHAQTGRNGALQGRKHRERAERHAPLRQHNASDNHRECVGKCAKDLRQAGRHLVHAARAGLGIAKRLVRLAKNLVHIQLCAKGSDDFKPREQIAERRHQFRRPLRLQCLAFFQLFWKRA